MRSSFPEQLADERGGVFHGKVAQRLAEASLAAGLEGIPVAVEPLVTQLSQHGELAGTDASLLFNSRGRGLMDNGQRSAGDRRGIVGAGGVYEDQHFSDLFANFMQGSPDVIEMVAKFFVFHGDVPFCQCRRRRRLGVFGGGMRETMISTM
ncbi:MAG: hypothetical protein CVU65_10990 [Deltaproteobacteria bacterium HGW-Deltaproteobacteria-22]|nr:MAG: hypothetical protein CVU65_10990 [Deltaproteobacteria bacterium HGW-Deltaproteobacteria-22]